MRGNVCKTRNFPPWGRRRLSQAVLERAVGTLAAENALLRAELARARAERRRPPLVRVGGEPLTPVSVLPPWLQRALPGRGTVNGN